MIRRLALCLCLVTPPALAEIPLDKIRAFAEIFEQIRANYVEEVSDEQLLDSAIRGMLSELDPHSSYLPPANFEDFQEATSGEFGGLGIEVAAEMGGILVVSPIDGTPAAEAGIQSGDLIVEIDGEDVLGTDLGRAIEMLRGPAGTDVSIVVKRGVESLDFTLTRALISVASVRSTELAEGFGWIRISQFAENTGQETRDALAKLSENDLRGVVLDLRNNPGGVLGAAVGVVDAFVDRGTIVTTRSRDDAETFSFSARAQAGDNTTVPLVVLINGGSASASEIVAGAVQDLKRGVVMGTPSFGKGSVQSLLPMRDGSALKLTTALYYTPDGRSIQASGISPDIRVEQGTFAAEDERRFMRESDLAGSLDNPNGEESADNESNPLLESDFQLREALNMLKGLSIVQ